MIRAPPRSAVSWTLFHPSNSPSTTTSPRTLYFLVFLLNSQVLLETSTDRQFSTVSLFATPRGCLRLARAITWHQFMICTPRTGIETTSTMPICRTPMLERRSKTTPIPSDLCTRHPARDNRREMPARGKSCRRPMFLRTLESLCDSEVGQAWVVHRDLELG